MLPNDDARRYKVGWIVKEEMKGEKNAGSI